MRYSQTNKPPLGSQINWAHPLSKGLVACYLMNEGSGNKIYDLSGNNNTGTLINGPVWEPGRTGQALKFDGVDDYINVPDNDSFSFTNGTNDLPFSVSLWERRTSSQGTGFFGKYLDDAPFNGEWSCSVLAANTYYFQLIDDNPQVRIKITSSLTGALNQWNHVVFTYDGSGDEPGLDVYVNGVKDTSPTRNEENDYVKMTNYSAPLNIGAILRESGLYSSYFNGKLDDVRIYNRALSAREVAQLYQSPYAMFEQTPSWMKYVSTVSGNRRRRILISGVYR